MCALKTPCCALDAHRAAACPTCAEPIRLLCATLPYLQVTPSPPPPLPPSGSLRSCTQADALIIPASASEVLLVP
eukprot:2188358-Pleurochrysis_carterae.AAC.3